MGYIANFLLYNWPMITVKACRATSWLEKTRGLMFRDKINPIYFETRFGVHTFFVREPLLIVILDENDLVVKLKKVNPWRLFFWNPKYSRVLELPFDHPQVDNIKIGSGVELKLSG